jgi:hypothetical protein
MPSNPLNDIRALRAVDLVLKAGEVVRDDCHVVR